MDYDGLVVPYPVGRPLTDEERNCRLEVGVATSATPRADHEVISRTDEVIEVVDKYYDWKGLGTFFSVVLLAVLATPIAMTSLLLLRSSTAFRGEGRGGAVFFVCVVVLIGLPLLALLVWLLTRETFTWSHYPVRFDRHRRRIFVRRTKRGGGVLEASWGEVFWHARHSRHKPTGAYTWSLAGHVMASDGKTVRETFSFGRSRSSAKELYPLWEHVRRFMHGGPGAVPAPHEVLPIAGRREGFWWGAHMIIFVAPANLALTLLLLPILAPAALFRWLAMRTNRVPAWPPGVEAAAAVNATASTSSALSRDDRARVAAALVTGLAAAAALTGWLVSTLRS